jgi:chaperonin GroEL
MKQKKQRIEDALNATRAASKRASSPAAASRCCAPARRVDGLKVKGDERFGARDHQARLEAPMRQIAENAGADGSVVVEKRSARRQRRLQRADRRVRRHVQGRHHRSGQGRALTALQNAASIAGLLLTTDSMVTDSRTRSKASVAGSPVS